MRKNVFKPTGEKIFMASIPFFLVVPVVAYVVLNFFFDLGANLVGNIFSMIAFVCYNIIALFAIPFEGMFGVMGMLEYGGGIFEYGMLSVNFAGMLFAQSIYAVLFYAVFSVGLFLRSGKKMRHVFGSRN